MSMMLGYHDDGKEEDDSFNIFILGIHDSFKNNHDVWSHDFGSLRGEGKTKEEALEDFKKN